MLLSFLSSILCHVSTVLVLTSFSLLCSWTCQFPEHDPVSGLLIATEKGPSRLQIHICWHAFFCSQTCTRQGGQVLVDLFYAFPYTQHYHKSLTCAIFVPHAILCLETSPHIPVLAFYTFLEGQALYLSLFFCLTHIRINFLSYVSSLLL